MTTRDEPSDAEPDFLVRIVVRQYYQCGPAESTFEDKPFVIRDEALWNELKKFGASAISVHREHAPTPGATR